MELTVKGKNIDIGDALRSYCEDAVNKLVSKYFASAMTGQVTVHKQAHVFIVDISLHGGRNIMIHAEGEAAEPYAAVDSAGERLAKQLKRYKSRLRDHGKAAGGTESIRAKVTQFAPEAAGEDEELPVEAQPVIVAEMESPIDELSVSEAVMRMDLGNLPTLMFRNRSHGGLNMVYRRRDGHISWVDPRDLARA